MIKRIKAIEALEESGRKKHTERNGRAVMLPFVILSKLEEAHV